MEEDEKRGSRPLIFISCLLLSLCLCASVAINFYFADAPTYSQCQGS